MDRIRGSELSQVYFKIRRDLARISINKIKTYSKIINNYCTITIIIRNSKFYKHRTNHLLYCINSSKLNRGREELEQNFLKIVQFALKKKYY